MATKSRWVSSPRVHRRLNTDKASTGATAEEMNRYRCKRRRAAAEPCSLTYRFTRTLVSKYAQRICFTACLALAESSWTGDGLESVSPSKPEGRHACSQGAGSP